MRVERCIDGVARNRQQHGVTVRGSMCDHFGADIACRSGPVVDDELLIEPLSKGLGDHTSEDVRRQPCGEADNDVNGSGRVVERRGKTRQSR